MREPRFPGPVLLADIGGTNARFALMHERDGPISTIIRLSTAGFADVAGAAREAIAKAGWPRPGSMLIGAAGPVSDRSVSLTNARWRIDGPALIAALGLEQGLLLNDFETLGIALPALGAGDLMEIGTARTGGGTRLVIGPGTGLGVGALADVDGHFLPLSSEGGHAGLLPESEDEQALFQHYGFGSARPQAETLLAGPGLPRLHQAMARRLGIAAPVLEPAEIVTGALGGTDPVADATISAWLDLLARFAGDMALTFLATGGVYLAGGILPRIPALIDQARFRARFERNETQSALLARLPLRLITAEEPAFIGLAALASRPKTYLLRYGERLWT